MPQQLTITNAGLFTAPNPFSQVPPGAMVKADNYVIDSNGVLELRRGNDILGVFPTAAQRAQRYTSFQNQLFSIYGDPLGTSFSLAYWTGSAWSTYSGTYSHPNATLARIRFLQAASNLYWTSSTGIKKLDSYTNSPTMAGMYPGLDISATTTGSSGFLTNGSNFSINGYIQSGQDTIQGVPNLASLSIGQFVTGTNIAAGSTIQSIVGNTITLSQNTTGTNVTSQGLAAIIANSTSMQGYYTSGSNPVAGNYVYGQGINPGTVVESITGSAPYNIVLSQPAILSNVVLVTTGTTASSTAVTALASTVGITVGQYVTGTGIPANTTVSAISGTGITLSQAATSSVTGVTLTFFSPTSTTQFTFYDSTTWTSYTGNSVAYRQVWGIEDANNNQNVGPPTGRAVVYNTAATSVDVNVKFSIPQGVTTSDYYQVYRTLSSGGNFDPGDEEQLVFEGNPQSSDLTNGYISFTDITPDALLGEALYTNASQQGIDQANYQPPLAWDMATFRNFTFYANTVSIQTLNLTMLAAGTSGGVTIGDVIVIGGTSYTAASSETPASGQFQVFSSGTPAQNIANTAESLVRVINQYASNTSVYAIYESGTNDLPGMILLQARGIGASSFAATASAHGNAWNPVLPTSGTSVSSTNNTYLNGLSVSKVGQPEAVPLVNQYFVGSAAYRILRILPLQNSLLILKEQEGVFRLYGYDLTSFVIDLVDSSARILAPDSAVVLNNQVWALTDQGITTISDTGSSVDSRPIEDQLLSLYGDNLAGVKQYSTGIAYETDRKYIFFTVSGADDTFPTQAFVFNTFTKAFTRWPLSKTVGFVNPVDNKLYLGDGLSQDTHIERKTYTYQDYIDPGTTYTITTFSGTTVYLTSSNEINIGDLLYQSSSAQSVITDVQPGYVVVQSQLTWTPGAATVYPAINGFAEWVPISVSNPGTMKQCPEVSLIFKNQGFTQATLSFASDVSQSYESVTLEGTATALWGLFPWGELPWGGATAAGPLRALIPREKQRCSELRMQFQVRQAYSNLQLLGFSIPVGEDSTFFVNR